MISREWERRFKARILAVLLKPPTRWNPSNAALAADAEYEAFDCDDIALDGDPEAAADEVLSYWGDGI